jgi:hypothetical protein
LDSTPIMPQPKAFVRFARAYMMVLCLNPKAQALKPKAFVRFARAHMMALGFRV